MDRLDRLDRCDMGHGQVGYGQMGYGQLGYGQEFEIPLEPVRRPGTIQFTHLVNHGFMVHD